MKQLREVNACTKRYTFLRKALGPKYGDKKPITMTQILDLSGMDDCIWAIFHTQNGTGEKLLRLFACDCAEHVLPIFEKKFPKDARPREFIAVARRFANGEVSAAAWVAAWAAAWAAARAAAMEAAGAAETKWQVDRLREMLANITR